ncbi:hypothetical protein AB0A73_21700 [Glycomyces sp. NPDC047369]
MPEHPTTAPVPLEAMTFRDLPEFLKREAAMGRLGKNVASTYATACRRALECFPDLAQAPFSVAEADRLADDLKHSDSDLSRDTLAQYAAGLRKVARHWFELKTGNHGSHLVEHALQLRPDLTVRLALPSDITAVEAAFLSEFVQRLRPTGMPEPT